jgi:hypothetical protein
MGELTPRQFVDTYLRLIPFIISQRHLQTFDIKAHTPTFLKRKETPTNNSVDKLVEK